MGENRIQSQDFTFLEFEKIKIQCAGSSLPGDIGVHYAVSHPKLLSSLSVSLCPHHFLGAHTVWTSSLLEMKTLWCQL